MSFISYAQNFEDVVLWRALKDVDKGFYIDVGANDPVVDSVTKSFYDRGWSGINIEPLSEFFNKLKVGRPRDINLNVVCTSSNGSIEFYEFEGTGLSTINNLTAAKHQLNGLRYEKKIVECKTLDSILEAHQVDCIHFLKIDVEGAEKDVLDGINLNKNKPWVILLEANEPLIKTERKVAWEHILIDAGYKFTYFDGLNNSCD
jgi:FkbM family methyltransferase